MLHSVLVSADAAATHFMSQALFLVLQLLVSFRLVSFPIQRSVEKRRPTMRCRECCRTKCCRDTLMVLAISLPVVIYLGMLGGTIYGTYSMFDSWWKVVGSKIEWRQTTCLVHASSVYMAVLPCGRSCQKPHYTREFHVTIDATNATVERACWDYDTAKLRCKVELVDDPDDDCDVPLDDCDSDEQPTDFVGIAKWAGRSALNNDYECGCESCACRRCSLGLFRTGRPVSIAFRAAQRLTRWRRGWGWAGAVQQEHCPYQVPEPFRERQGTTEDRAPSCCTPGLPAWDTRRPPPSRFRLMPTLSSETVRVLRLGVAVSD